MSALPSPSKSPTPAMLQLRSTLENVAPLEIEVAFMSQITFSPVARLRHRMSDLPSPLKSLRTTRLLVGSAGVETSEAVGARAGVMGLTAVLRVGTVREV